LVNFDVTIFRPGDFDVEIARIWKIFDTFWRQIFIRKISFGHWIKDPTTLYVLIPGPVMSLADVAVGLKVFLHTDDKDVYSGFMGRYIFLKEKSIFGDGKSTILMVKSILA
jgi:hypothetical protein